MTELDTLRRIAELMSADRTDEALAVLREAVAAEREDIRRRLRTEAKWKSLTNKQRQALLEFEHSLAKEVPL